MSDEPIDVDFDGQEPDEQRTSRRLGLIVGTIVVVGVLAILVIGLLASQRDTSIADALAEGDPYPAPDFSLPILANGAAIDRRDGEDLALSDLRGRPVVVNFWASWCTPCEAEAPLLEAAWKRYEARGVVMLGVDVQDLSDNAREFIARHRQSYPHVRDGSDDTYREYGLTGIPETFFIDTEGLVRAKAVGELSRAQLDNGIRLILPRANR